ncbi:hypothetical protein BDW74DRAFT_148830 [Aspergillus multicolor]|uniref:uncharacterized protein n=1 Tax=Aspergillus multicolor TaxID=41759 RepID=UPI003CCCDF08
MRQFATFFASGNLVRRDSDILLNPPRELDEPLLAVQIGGIVGAYVIFVAIILTLLLVVGRRLRRTVQSSNYTLQVEMMKPKHPPISTTAAAAESNAAFNSIDPSPVSPTNKSHGFRSWTSLTKAGGQSHSRSNNNSVGTIDHNSVVAADRRRNQDQMEMLYAAVMEHDERRAAANAGSPVSPTDDVSLKDLSPRSPSSYQNPFSDYAARDYSTRLPEEKPLPPMPQPTHQYPAPAVTTAPPPTSPGGRSTTSRLSRISNLSLFHSNRDTNTSHSHSHSQSSSSRIRSPRLPGRKHNQPLGINISSPLASPAPTSPHSDQIPLSPRFYNPAPPPLPPKAGAPLTRIATNTTTGSHRTPAPPPLNLQTATPTSAKAGRSSSSLPFREAYPQLLSAPPTKTTILERPEKQANGPRTGLPTPYSPYMPFTPLTPLTPSRIVTKKQRKRQGKENGLRALNEEDAVRGEDEMWGY